MSLTVNDLQKVANLLTDKFNIKVEIGGAKAFTDGKTIHLPSLPPIINSKRLLTSVRAFLDHEAGHIIAKSDFSLAGKAKKEHGVAGHAVLNALEDGRSEAVMAEAFAGCGYNIRTGTRQLLEDREERIKGGDENEIAAVSNPLKQLVDTIYLRSVGEPTPSYADDEIRSVVDDLEAEVGNLRDVCENAKSTSDLWPIMERVAQLMQQQPDGGSGQGEDQPDQSDGDQSQGDGESDGQGESQGDGESDGQGESQGDGESDPSDDKGDRDGESQNDQQKAGGDKANSGQGESGDQSSGDDDGETSASGAGSDHQVDTGWERGGQPVKFDDVKSLNDENADQAVEEALDELSDGMFECSGDSAFLPEYRFHETDVRDCGMPDVEAIANAKQAAKGMAHKLSQLFMAEARKGWRVNQRAGRPDPLRLASLASGTSTRVMRKPVRVEAPDTAVALLLDQSGSMERYQRHLSMVAALVFADVLDSAGHKSMVVGMSGGMTGDQPFNFNYSTETVKPKDGRHGGTLYRIPPDARHIMNIGKRWHERFKPNCRRIASLYQAPMTGGGTPLGEAIFYCGQQLLHRSEERKAVIAFTDGRPNSPIESTCRQLEAAGITVAIITIGTELPPLHTRQVCCMNVSDLPRETLKQLGKVLEL